MGGATQRLPLCCPATCNPAVDPGWPFIVILVAYEAVDGATACRAFGSKYPDIDTIYDSGADCSCIWDRGCLSGCQVCVYKCNYHYCPKQRMAGAQIATKRVLWSGVWHTDRMTCGS